MTDAAERRIDAQIELAARQAPPAPAWEAPVIAPAGAQRIIGFWHIGAVGDWSRIAAEQYRKLRDAGLYDASIKIVVGFVGGRDRARELAIPILEDPKFDVFATADARDFEYPTLARLWQEARADDRPYLCYYFHTKGASRAGAPTGEAVNAWREYMEYFTIERWEDCVRVLAEYETCGVELQSGESHYSGNFWWATSGYVRRLPDALAYWRKHRDDRVPAEFYVCLARPKAYCFNDFTENLYDVRIDTGRYRR